MKYVRKYVPGIGLVSLAASTASAEVPASISGILTDATTFFGSIETYLVLVGAFFIIYRLLKKGASKA